MVKLSIHWWQRRSAGGSGSEAPGPSKPVTVKVEPAHDEKEVQANEKAWERLEELEGQEGPEAKAQRSQAVGEQPVPNETKV